MTFRAKLWRYAGAGNWIFVTVPKKYAPPIVAHFGMAPVVASIDGGPVWKTKTWRTKAGVTVLAVPKRVRKGKDDGDSVKVTLEFDY